MRPFAALALGMLVISAAHAQSAEPSPEDDFIPWTGESAERGKQPPPAGVQPPNVTPPPVIERPPAASTRRAPADGRMAGGALVSQEFNHVSIYGAPTLGTLNRGLAVYLGFPLVGLRAAIGAAPRLDVGVGFDSFYGSMNEVRLVGKYLLGGGRAWAVAGALEAGAAFFAQRPEAEGHGPRWLTGRRNYNAEIGLLTSYRGPSPQSARLFLDVRYHLGIDTQPYAQDPLAGVPPAVQLGHNVPVRMGAEMPFSPRASFLFVFGFEIHGREGDSRFMPLMAVGLVTGV
jgi:hypothetical protein